MIPFVYLDGVFVPESEARLSVFDGGWLHGAGLFETMRAENGRAFRLESHIERLRRSAAKLLHAIERSDLPSEEDVVGLLKRNEVSHARIRLTVSAGSMRALDAETPIRPTICMTTAPLSAYPPGFYERGIQVVVSPFKQSPDDPTIGHKTTGHLSRLLSLRHAQKAGCLEALWFTTENHLAEGSISNVFLVAEGGVKTPGVDTPILPGITRAIVLDLAPSLNLEAREGPLTIHDLLDADECFLTNSIMGIMPVIRVERHDIGGGRVGRVTQQIRAAYVELVERECGIG
jgi:branched-subunit amino acid aminotransferase/4-amino-4-deoxychorismate lyase